MNKNIAIAAILSLSMTFSGCGHTDYTPKQVNAAKVECEANGGVFVVRELSTKVLVCRMSGGDFYMTPKGE